MKNMKMELCQQTNGLTQLSYDKNSKVGKYVTYDNKKWIVLYDDDLNGLQIISEKPFSDGNVSLGYEDTSFEEKDVIDIDGNGEINWFEKAMYSYSNAVETLNKKCESLVNKKSGLVKEVRSVGSNPIEPNKETAESFTMVEDKREDLFKKELNLETKFDGKRTYYENKATKKEYVIKNTDLNYISDIDRMIALEIFRPDVETNDRTELEYWIASRLVGLDSEDITFSIRCTALYSDNTFNISDEYICCCLWGGSNYFNPSKLLRPVITLMPGALDNIEGDGSAENPYNLD